MGIVNRTPDSFYDGGAHLADEQARARLRQLCAEQADIVDIGAESTRPGAAAVSADEQIRRLGDLVEYAVDQGAVVSVDTTSAEVAAWALERGARMINSVSLAPAAALGALCARQGARLVLAHCRGAMADMAGFSVYRDEGYDDVVADVAREWRRAAQQALEQGLGRDELIFDPGLGFAKNAAQSLELCARLAEFRQLGHPILVGPSRKSYLAHVAAAELDAPLAEPAERLGGTVAAVLGCVAQGADIVRVHDVAAVRQALAYAAALEANQRRTALGKGACVRGGGQRA